MKRIFLVTAVAMLFASCNTNSERNGAKYGGTLRVNISDIPHVVFPGQITKRSEQVIVNQVYDGLIKYHQRSLEIVPAIAKKYDISSDGLTYTFTLRSNARFQNDRCFPQGKGRQIVASDFKYSIEQICRNKLNDNYDISRQVENIVGAENFLPEARTNDSVKISGIIAKNDSTLIINLKKPDDLFIYYLAGPNALVFAPEAYNAYGVNGTVGSGAFCMKYPQVKGQPIELKYNPKYWKSTKQGEQLPFLDSLIFTFVTSTQKELYMFSSGKVDVVFGLQTKYLASFLEENIESFQSDPPLFVLTNTVNPDNDKRFNLLKSNIHGLVINSQNYFDFSDVYLKTPEPRNIVLEE